MGMGEPLHNLKGVLPAINMLCHDSGFGLSGAGSRSRPAVSFPGSRS